jgi:hypothetical protein
MRKHLIEIQHNILQYRPSSVCERTIPTERALLFGEVSANFCGQLVPLGRDGSLQPYSQISRQEALLFLSSSSSIVLTRLSGPCSKPTSQKIW